MNSSFFADNQLKKCLDFIRLCSGQAAKPVPVVSLTRFDHLSMMRLLDHDYIL